MKSKKTIKNILIGLVIAVALLIVYSLVAAPASNTTGGNNSLSSLLQSSSFGRIEENQANLANAEILRILGSIKSISLEDDIFSNPAFAQLNDTQFTIPSPLRVGRPNPFLPIGFDAIFEAQSSSDLSDVLEGEGEVSGSDFFEEPSA